MYADPLVILGCSPIDIQKKLETLEEYCNTNDIKISPRKTNIMFFHKCGLPQTNRTFTCQKENIEKIKIILLPGSTIQYAREIQGSCYKFV